jgi:uncharacterized protein YceK
MKKQILTVCVLALATSGCGKVMSFAGLTRGETTTPAARPAAMSLSEPVREVQAPPAVDANGTWESNVARDIPYFNMSTAAIPIYSEPERETEIGSLAPGTGGYIETCSDAMPMCKVAYADAASGWVRMDHMGGVTN